MRGVLVIAIALALVGSAHAQTTSKKTTAKPSVGKTSSAPKAKLLTLDPDVIKPNTFSWAPDLSPTGPVVIVVSLNEQRMHVYRNGIRIAVSTVSSGIAGRDTPSGSYEILQKKTMHHSNLYSNAPMPFMQRLTWDGIALHAGYNPGHAASHGCVRMPKAFSEKLYGITKIGTRVIITDDLTASIENLIHPGDVAPIDAITGVPVPEADSGTWPVVSKKKAGTDTATKPKDVTTPAAPTAVENVNAPVRANAAETPSQAETPAESTPVLPKAEDPALVPHTVPVTPAPQTPEKPEKSKDSVPVDVAEPPAREG
ncbi:L,D-transpeptidase family protein [Lysobacter sp. HDW10]|uniref:L,D-transpeptidase family protein n=1 Tax=Lysobacter sp. HDW10 TaxID=2714936 RepID=UPI00140ABCE7|nr:L,D-transpeptidase family protein [Lysobacter sp. HDW10]QIK80806.1 L,D-transpeptidase family protein [Lysobacter sp. HDW10]